ncbi:MAG: hypothetical protein ACI8XO_001147, partial [Verrucomicrobiales bacterium]
MQIFDGQGIVGHSSPPRSSTPFYADSSESNAPKAPCIVAASIGSSLGSLSDSKILRARPGSSDP